MAITKQIPLYSAEIANRGVALTRIMSRVLNSHWYILGEEVANFEREFSAYVGADHCVSVANGTEALELALRGLGVHRGDVVITVANAGFYGSTAIHAIGAVPLYVDTDEVSLTMAPTSLERALATKPKAVIVTHLYGQLADVETLVALCRQAGVPLLEDCAQAHGAVRNGQQAGSFGDVGCFSFYPTKNLGALGDGGAVVTQSTDLAARIRSLRQYGWSQKYTVATPGGRNSRLDEMQAAILREKLPHLERWNAQRREIARRYSEAFAGLPVRCPPSMAEDYVAHLYVIRLENRGAFRGFLKDRGVATDIHYPIPDHLQPAYANARTCGGMRTTETACARVVSLPCFPGLLEDEVAVVIDAVRLFFQQGRR
jgi:dTDP-4-amino-4,6-dideoxygalactose transaminase